MAAIFALARHRRTTLARTKTREALRSRRILVVEDEYFLADDVAIAVAKLGGEIVGPVPTPEAALAALSAGKSIDAAVLDINLRGELVFPVADALTERQIPFVFATGYDEAALPLAYRAVPRWEKPFDVNDLATKLAALIR